MHDSFSKEKSDFLGKKDKSSKGFIDKDIIDVVLLLNSKEDYYTTSSCAGRIVLLEMKSRRKNECSWIFAEHRKVKLHEILLALDKNITEQIWFKQQPLILHVACKDIQCALRLLEISRKIFKHSGIISSTHKTTIEIIGSERIETIIADKSFIADEKYINQLVKYANLNFDENFKKTRTFLKSLEAKLL